MQSVLHDVHDLRDKIPRVQRDGFTGLKIDLHIIFLRKLRDELFQQGDVISGLGDVMSAAEVHPFAFVQILTELFLDSGNCLFKRLKALFAEGMEMYAVNALKCVLIEIRGFHAEARERRAGVIYRLVLGGAFGVYAYAYALSLAAVTEFPELCERVEHDMIGNLRDLTELAVLVCWAEAMHFAAELLSSELCLIQSACGSSGQVFRYQRIYCEHRECFLREKYLCAGPIRHTAQYFEVAHQSLFVENVCGCGYVTERRICK